jgi:anaerobic selenocysteine-containing dehydrogenase
LVFEHLRIAKQMKHSRARKKKQNKMNRRKFLKTLALTGAGGVALAGCSKIGGLGNLMSSDHVAGQQPYDLAKPENVIYSVCLNCHIRCPMKTKFQDGVLVKIDGNPYAAKTFLPNIPFETQPVEAARVDGHFCPKGQAGVQTYYDPYRIRHTLKRVGPRGGNQWQTISFDQAIEEIVEGGNLFGEGHVPGLREIYSLKDPKIAQTMAADVEALRKGILTVKDFQSKHADHLDTLIDPEHPDLGPKNNQFCFMAGRIQNGRSSFAKRWTYGGLGSINWLDHTSICGRSHWTASERTTWDPVKKKGKVLLKPDFLHSEFVIFWGTGAFEANFGCTAIANMVTEAMEKGRLKVAVVDPRLSHTAAKAWKWIPVKPGQDIALALGMIRWIIENKRYDRRYLENANKPAAQTDGEPTFADAAHLVRLDTHQFLRTEDLELPAGTRVVMTSSGPKASEAVEHGLLEVDTIINKIPIKSVFTILKESAQEKTLKEYARLAGVKVEDIVQLADEFTRHGKKVGIDRYRGAGQHTNGYNAEKAILSLNILLGNQDWKGGMTSGGGHWQEMGGQPTQLYDLKKGLHPGALTKFGVPITREKCRYEDSTLVSKYGYPAKRPWYPITKDVYQEVIPSAEEKYPYPLKCLWIHMGTPAYASPGGGEFIRILKDPSIIPLVITDDTVLGETTVFTDYVFPDLTFLERWGTPYDNPQPAVKTSGIRQPAAPPLPEEVEVAGETMPISMEAIMLAIADKLGMPGFGKNGFGPNMDFSRPEDFYLKLVANIAMDGRPLPDTSQEETNIFLKARKHLPPSVFDFEKWERAVHPEVWPKVVYLLNRGGRFESFDDAYVGNHMSHKFGKLVNIYVEDVAITRNSITGKYFDGLPRYEPPLHSDGSPVEDSTEEFPFNLITYKTIMGGNSRTISQSWSHVSVDPENQILINRVDAEARGWKNGDRVRLVSATNPKGTWPLAPYADDLPVESTLSVVEGLRPGVIAVSFHYGHWAYGARDVMVDGKTIPGDTNRSRGTCPNAVMRLDKYNKATCLTDPIGGSSSFLDTKINLVKV